MVGKVAGGGRLYWEVTEERVAGRCGGGRESRGRVGCL